MQFHSDNCSHRDLESHIHYCDLIETDHSGRGGFSVTYGINSRSVLMELPFFDVTKCMPYDIMHTVFEAVSGHLLNQLFEYLITDDIITLDEINLAVNQVCSGYSEIDSIPAPVYRDAGPKSKFHFKQKVCPKWYYICIHYIV